MAKLSKQEIEHIAELSRLEFSKKEKDKFQENLSSILDYVSNLQKVNTKDIEPIAQITGLSNVMRKDVLVTSDKGKVTNIQRKNTRAALLKNTPEQESGFIKIKAVFEE